MTDPSEFNRKPAYIIVLLAFLQVWSATYFLRIEGFYAVNSILFLSCGLGISYFTLKLPDTVIDRKQVITPHTLWRWGSLLLLLPLSYYFSRDIMDKTPLEKEYADMLPIMKVMAQRAIGGGWSHVYDPIPEIWDGIQPIYLPAIWLPFTSSVLLQFDMRWVTVCGIWLSVMLCLLPGRWRKKPVFFLFVSAILVLLAWLHFDKVNNVIRLTEEGVVFFYYSLLIAAVFSRKAWLVGVTAALCLLSRYALIGWIPFACLYLLFTRQYRFLWQSLAAGTVVLLLLVIIPFGWKPLLIHWQLHSQYIDHAARVWKENPEYFHRSLGMAKFFGAANISWQHSILLIASFVLPLLFLFLLKKKNIASHLVLASCLQFCITVFYNFLDVSYLYLFYTPVFVSLGMAGWALAISFRGNKHVSSS